MKEMYCVTCKKNTANENLTLRKTKQNRLMLLSNCIIVGRKSQAFLKIKNSIK